MTTNRLYFIDIIRAFAILMMLQGHFIDTLLSESYRNLNSNTFSIWLYFRGITAPTFFTISGLIFTYLLIKAKEKAEESENQLQLIANSFVFKEPVFNYSGDFPFLWDEIKIPVQYGSNYDLAKEIFWSLTGLVLCCCFSIIFDLFLNLFKNAKRRNIRQIHSRC